ncbi:NERD domain-containing protein [Oceanobacillus piezotolerans]|uniref:NERD domain-containing protein n=1 Tax=Oceanobacillus piezotolerans TaxID=2448030 RepID=A0A498DBU5_9BACI|nr:nuclease-related domain-containing protein [Oceanobacillus piezotolerans]RLL45510.1 NERD domain-containing protein [Oceanobacillus piezotolerans]
MLYKSRSKSSELNTLEILNYRMDLSNKNKQHYFNLKKGYEGEVIFDLLTERLDCDCLILNDLLLEVNNTSFQIDSLLIIQGKIYFYEVKNYEGDFYYEADRFYKKPKYEVVNPFTQLTRTESLLRQLLTSLGYSLQINSFLVFIHPNFNLYQAPLNAPIIFPNQIKAYLNNLNSKPSKLTERHMELAAQLFSLHKNDSPYTQIPTYDYDRLRKGIICPQCQSFSMLVIKQKCICHNCEYQEPKSNAVLSSIREFQVLFPNEKISTNIIYEWCKEMVSKKSIRRILSNHFETVGVRQWTYYKEK